MNVLVVVVDEEGERVVDAGAIFTDLFLLRVYDGPLICEANMAIIYKSRI